MRRYEELGKRSVDALKQYAADVRAGTFPNTDESYTTEREAPARLERIYG